MIGLKKLLDCVCTEAIEDYTSPEEQKRIMDSLNLPPVHYSYRVIEERDGSLSFEG